MSTTRKFREYKGWVFDPQIGAFYRLATGTYYAKAFTALSVDLGLSDDDHAPLMALKADPYEPVVTLERIVEEAVDRAYMAGRGLSLNWEGTHALTISTAERIRTAFPHVDTPPVAPTPLTALTAQDHIDALMKMGASLTRHSGIPIYLSLDNVVQP